MTEPWLGRVEQSAGGQLWAVTTNGLLEFRNGEWVSHRVKEIAAENQTRSRDGTKSIPLFPVRQSRVLILLRDRLLEFNAEEPDRPRVETLLSGAQTQLGAFSSLSGTRDDGLWIGGRTRFGRVPGAGSELECEKQMDRVSFALRA